MKLKTKILILMGSSMLLVFAVNVGIASADHPGRTEWDCNVPQGGDTACPGGERVPIGPAAQNTLAPVGQHIAPEDAPGHPGAVNGFDNEKSNAAVEIVNNPLCPFHDVTM